MSSYECPCGCHNLRKYGFPATAANEHRAWKERQIAGRYGAAPSASVTAANYLIQASSPANADIMADLTKAAELAEKSYNEFKKGTNVTNKQTSGTNRRAALERAVDFHDSGIGDASQRDVLETADAFYAWLQEETPALPARGELKAKAEPKPAADERTTTEWITCGTPLTRASRAVHGGQAYENWIFPPSDRRFASPGYAHHVTTTHPSNEDHRVYAMKRVTREGGKPVLAEYRIMKRRLISVFGLPTDYEPVIIGAFTLNAVQA